MAGKYPRFSVSQKERAVLDAIKTFLGYGCMTETKGHHFNYIISSRENLKRFIPLMENRLISKAKQFQQWRVRANL